MALTNMTLFKRIWIISCATFHKTSTGSRTVFFCLFVCNSSWNYYKNKKSHWLEISAINVECQPVKVRYCINILSYSVLFIKKKLCRTEVFSGILSNLTKQKLAITKANILNKKCNKSDSLGSFFLKRGISSPKQKKWTSYQISAEAESSDFWTKFVQKGYFWSKVKKSEHHLPIEQFRISLGTKFRLKHTILSF